MMEKHDHFFTPDHVDEQIEDYARGWPITPESQLLAEMHQVIQQIRAEQHSSLQRTWLRLQQKSREYAISTQQRRKNTMQDRQFITLPNNVNQHSQKKPAHRAWYVLSVTIAVTVVALTILSWTLFLFIHGLWQRTQLVAPPTAQSAYLVCSVPDTVASLRFATSYDLEWSSSGKIAFTYPYALAVNVANCTRDMHYQNSLKGATTATWSPDGKYLLVLASDISQTEETDALYVLDSNGKVLASTVIDQKKLVAGKQIPDGPYMSSLSGGGTPINTFFGPVWSPDGHQINAIFASSDANSPVLKSWTWDVHHHTLILKKKWRISMQAAML